MEQSAYPQAEQPAVQPVAGAAAVQIPEGFAHDPNSGMYYKSTPGFDINTGAPGNTVTWFNPGSGEYSQHFYAN